MKQHKHLSKAKRSPKQEEKRRKKAERKAWDRPEIDYRARNAALRTLGFENYAEYLESKLWKSIRERVLERDKHRCRFCNLRATSVHHSSYAKEVLLGLELRWLAAICSSCHHRIEFTTKGRKRTPAEVSEQYRKIRRSTKSLLFFGIQLMADWETDLDHEFQAIVRDFP